MQGFLLGLSFVVHFCSGSGGIYFIKSRNSVGYEETECHSAGEAIPQTDCTGSGWTYIGELSGNPNTVIKSV
jgi:hypothetical protein